MERGKEPPITASQSKSRRRLTFAPVDERSAARQSAAYVRRSLQFPPPGDCVMRVTRSIMLRLSLVCAAAPLAAQAPKKVLTQADWDKWKSINAPALSNDGKWVAYTLIPQVGDGELIVRSTTGATEFRVPRGFLGRPNNTPGGLRGPAGGTGEGDPAGPTASAAQITADSRFVVASTQPSQAEVERAGRGRGAAAANRQSLAIVSLPDGKVTTIAGVRSFRLPRSNGAWLAYVPEPDSAAAGDSS